MAEKMGFKTSLHEESSSAADAVEERLLAPGLNGVSPDYAFELYGEGANPPAVERMGFRRPGRSDAEIPELRETRVLERERDEIARLENSISAAAMFSSHEEDEAIAGLLSQKGAGADEYLYFKGEFDRLVDSSLEKPGAADRLRSNLEQIIAIRKDLSRLKQEAYEYKERSEKRRGELFQWGMRYDKANPEFSYEKTLAGIRRELGDGAARDYKESYKKLDSFLEEAFNADGQAADFRKINCVYEQAFRERSLMKAIEGLQQDAEQRRESIVPQPARNPAFSRPVSGVAPAQKKSSLFSSLSSRIRGWFS